jgi:hypothetical protein
VAHPLFGVSIEQQPLYALYVTQLAQVVVACRPREQRPLLVSVALKPVSDEKVIDQQRHLLQRVEAMLKTLLTE